MNFSIKEVKVLNIEVAALSKNELLEKMKGSIDDGDRIRIAKVNTEFLERSLNSKEFEKILEKFEINVADGVGVLWAAKYLSLPLVKTPILKQAQAVWQMIYTGASLVFFPKYCQNPIPEAFRGVDLMKAMLEISSDNQAPVYFLGAKKEVLEKAVENIKKEFPNLIIAGFHDGYDFDSHKVINDIQKSGAEILFVGLGSPMQEYWINDNWNKLNNIKIAVGEGGSFEFLAGTFRRAPQFMRNIGLEWLWRLFANQNKTKGAGNRAKRVWKAVPVFTWETVKYKLNKR